MRQNSDFARRFLVFYSGALTLAFGFFVLCGFTPQKKASFDEITVQRINVIEPDGTTRLVISDKARFPGDFVQGKESPRPDRTGNGFLFMDDEGTELGGQMWGGSGEGGKPHSYGHLGFDRYNGDQTFAVNAEDDGGIYRTMLEINDSYSDAKSREEAHRIQALPAEQRAAAWDEYSRRFPFTPRVRLGRSGDGSSLLTLSDAKGRSRISLNVAADGAPSIELLDEAGKVVSRLPEAKP